MTVLLVAVFVGTTWGLWLAAAINLEAQGWSWYMRNWIAATVGLCGGLLTVFFLESDNIVGVLFGTGIIFFSATAPARAKRKVQQKNATPGSPSP